MKWWGHILSVMSTVFEPYRHMTVRKLSKKAYSTMKQVVIICLSNIPFNCSPVINKGRA